MNFHHGTEASRVRRRRTKVPPGRTYHTGNPNARIHHSERHRPPAVVTLLARQAEASLPPRQRPAQTLVADKQALPSGATDLRKPRPTETSTTRCTSRTSKMPEYCDLTGDTTDFKPISHDQGRQLLGLAPRIKSHIDLRESDDEEVSAGVASHEARAGPPVATDGKPYVANHYTQLPPLFELPPLRRPSNHSHAFNQTTQLPSIVDLTTEVIQFPHRPLRDPPGGPFREIEWTQSIPEAQQISTDGMYSPRWSPPSPSLPRRGSQAPSYAGASTSFLNRDPDLGQYRTVQTQSHVQVPTQGSDTLMHSDDRNSDLYVERLPTPPPRYLMPYSRPNLAPPTQQQASNPRSNDTPPHQDYPDTAFISQGGPAILSAANIDHGPSYHETGRPASTSPMFNRHMAAPSSTPASRRLGDGRVTKPAPRRMPRYEGLDRLQDRAQRHLSLYYGNMEDDGVQRRGQAERRDGL